MLPPGPIAALRPRAEVDLSVLPGEVRVVQGFRPDHDAFAARGHAVSVALGEGPHAAAVVFLPRSKREARALVAAAAGAVPRGAPVVVDGAKTDGVDSLLRECRARAALGGVVSKAHGKAFWIAASADAFADWAAAPSEGFSQGPSEGAWATAPGAFAEGGPDRGSELLAEALPPRLPPRVVDLGAGWGYLSARALEREGVEEVHLVEAEHAALEAARRNVTDHRAFFHWADVANWRPDGRFDLALANPPFHRGRAADPALGRAFLTAAARILSPRGTLLCVANRHLPYERALGQAFAEHREVGGCAAYKVIAASRPLGARRRAA